jgi:glutamate---cysteine ligase / carboxylate-amine ligase
VGAPMGASVTDPYGSLAEARSRFDASTDLTLAIEEEFQILDRSTLGLRNGFRELQAMAEGTPLAEHLAGELIECEVEVKTGRCERFAEAARLTVERRRELYVLADRLGVELCSTGTHPWSRWQDQSIIDTPHYQLVEESLRYVAWRNNTFGIHVHVGVQGHERAIDLMNRLRSILPDLLALSSSSPWTDGRMTHLHSTRTQHFTRMFPRCGIPEPFAGWDDYDAFCRFLLDSGSIREHTQIWWCVRPHQSFGTIELRNADGAPDVREAIALAAFGYLMAARALRGIDEGEPARIPAGRVLEENQWRAIRHGISGELIDLDTMRSVPAAERIRGLIEDAAPEVHALGLERYLAPIERMLVEGNCAQRAIRRLEQGATLEETFAEQVRETRESVDLADQELEARHGAG